MELEVQFALGFGIVGAIISIMALFQTQYSRKSDHQARLIDRAASRLETFESISGSQDMVTIERYKEKHKKERGGYYKHVRVHNPEEIEVARCKLAKFWKITIQLYSEKALPAEFFERGNWLRWGDRYRQLVEPLDIARYYRDKFFEANGEVEYEKAKNRPSQHRFLEDRWESVKREEESVLDSMTKYVEMEQRLRAEAIQRAEEEKRVDDEEKKTSGEEKLMGEEMKQMPEEEKHVNQEERMKLATIDNV